MVRSNRMSDVDCITFFWNRKRGTIESSFCKINNETLYLMEKKMLSEFTLRNGNLKLFVNLSDSWSSQHFVQYNVDGKLVLFPDEFFIVSSFGLRIKKMTNSEKRWVSKRVYPTGTIFKNNMIEMEKVK